MERNPQGHSSAGLPLLFPRIFIGLLLGRLCLLFFIGGVLGSGPLLCEIGAGYIRRVAADDIVLGRRVVYSCSVPWALIWWLLVRLGDWGDNVW